MKARHGIVWAVLGIALLVGAQEAAEPSLTARIFESWRGDLVLVKVGRANGSGFVCELDGKTYVFTCAHVLRSGQEPSLRLLDGREVPWSKLAFADGADLARLELSDRWQGGKHALRTDPPRMGEPVVVIGNDGGYGVATSEAGKVVGIGVGVIEVTAKIQPGISGAPILDVDGKVLGVASHGSAPNALSLLMAAAPDEPRRFGLVLAGRTWTEAEWADYSAHARRLSALDLLIMRDLAILVLQIRDRQSRTNNSRVLSGARSAPASSLLPPDSPLRKAMEEAQATERALRELAGSMVVGKADSQVREAWRALLGRRDAALQLCLVELRKELTATQWEAPLRTQSEELVKRLEALDKETNRLLAIDKARLETVAARTGGGVAPPAEKAGPANSAPLLLLPAAAAVLPQIEQRWVFEWGAVQEAAAYELYIGNSTRDQAFLNPVVSGTRYIRHPPPRRGGYLSITKGWFWRVRARNQEGVWGPWSPDRPFEVEPRKAE